MAKNEVVVTFLGDAKGLQKSTQQVEKAVGGLGKQLSGFGKALGGAFAATKVVNFAKQSVKAFGSLGEAINKSEELFGDAAGSVEAFSKTAAKELGQSQVAALTAAGTFAVFGKSAGKTGQDLAAFSTEMVTLASDLASFHDSSPERAVYALGSALRGEYEPARAFGYQLDVATIANKAMEMGLIDSAKELDAHSKTLAAQALLTQQAGDAVGDFARTSDSATNAQRILKAQFEEVSIAMGGALMPAFELALGVIMPLLDAFNNMSAPMKNAILMVGLAVAAFAVLSTTISGTVAAFGALGAATGLAMGPIAAIGIALVAGAAIYGAWTGATAEAEAAAKLFADQLDANTRALLEQEDISRQIVEGTNNERKATDLLIDSLDQKVLWNQAAVDSNKALGISMYDQEQAVVGGEKALRELVATTSAFNGLSKEQRDAIADIAIAEDVSTESFWHNNYAMNDAKRLLGDTTGKYQEQIQAVFELRDQQDLFNDSLDGYFESEGFAATLRENGTEGIWRQFQASEAYTAALGSENSQIAIHIAWLEAQAQYTEDLNFTKEIAAGQATRRALEAEAENTATAESAEELRDRQVAAVQGILDAYNAEVEMVGEWASSVQSGMESAARSVGAFQVDAETSLSDHNSDLQQGITDAQAYQTNMMTVFKNLADKPLADRVAFINHFTEMGAGGADMVADMAEHPDKIDETFGLVTGYAETMSTDMIAEFDKVAPGFSDATEEAERQAITALETAGVSTKAAAEAVGTGTIDGIVAGLDEGLWKIDIATSRIANAIKNQMADKLNMRSPSRVMRDEVGIPVTQGIAVGMEKALPEIDAATTMIQNELVHSFEAPDPGRSIVEAIGSGASTGTVGAPSAAPVVYNINVEAAGLGASSPEIATAVVNSIKSFERRNGVGWRS